MNLIQLQVALNHEDPNIVIRGLVEFEKHILREHNATAWFGYYGRSIKTDNSAISPAEMEYPAEILGLLLSYIKSSPNFSEFFSLWDLEGYDENLQFRTSHMSCFAAIIHCIHCDTEISKSIVSRLIKDHYKSFHSQLEAKHSGLVHSTLGLLLCICRSSYQAYTDVYLRIVCSCKSFSILSTVTKVIDYQNEELMKIQIHSRYFILLILFTFLHINDHTITDDLLLYNSLYRRAISNLHKDNKDTINLILYNIIYLLNSTTISYPIKSHLIDNNLIKSVIQLYEHDDELIQCASHKCLINISSILTSHSSTGKGAKQSYYKISHLMKLLQPATNIHQREVRMK